jgi:hypothetical protein
MVAGLFLSACSSGKGSNNTSRPTPSVGATPTVPAAVKTTNPLGGSAVKSPRPTLNPEIGPCTGDVFFSRNTGYPGTDYLRAAPTSQNTWGPYCDYLNPGDRCGIGWNASYTVLAGDAYIEYQAWSKEGDKPFSGATIGPLPGQNSFRNVRFRTVIPKTKQIAIRLILLNDKKVPVAVSDAYVYQVDCNRKSPSPTP